MDIKIKRVHGLMTQSGECVGLVVEGTACRSDDSDDGAQKGNERDGNGRSFSGFGKGAWGGSDKQNGKRDLH
jgi:hypothetical protein